MTGPVPLRPLSSPPSSSRRMPLRPSGPLWKAAHASAPRPHQQTPSPLSYTRPLKSSSERKQNPEDTSCFIAEERQSTDLCRVIARPLPQIHITPPFTLTFYPDRLQVHHQILLTTLTVPPVFTYLFIPLQFAIPSSAQSCPFTSSSPCRAELCSFQCALSGGLFLHQLREWNQWDNAKSLFLCIKSILNSFELNRTVVSKLAKGRGHEMFLCTREDILYINLNLYQESIL